MNNLTVIDWVGVTVPVTPWNPNKFILDLGELGVIRVTYAGASHIPTSRRWTAQLLYPGNAYIARGAEGWRALEAAFLLAKGEQSDEERGHARALVRWIDAQRGVYHSGVIEQLNTASERGDDATQMRLLAMLQRRARAAGLQ